MTAMLLTSLTLLAAPHEHGHHGGSHGNPKELDEYIAKQESPDRAAWQKPDEVVAKLGLKPGDTACDIGAGPGYFSLRLSKAVGPTGGVFAVDVEPKILEVLLQRIEKAGVKNVTPVLALPNDPLLPPKSCDVVMIIDTYHHFPDGVGYLKRVAASLKPGGRIVNIDFIDKETPVGPSVEHRIGKEAFIAAAKKAGLEVKEDVALLPYQYFVVLTPAAAK